MTAEIVAAIIGPLLTGLLAVIGFFAKERYEARKQAGRATWSTQPPQAPGWAPPVGQPTAAPQQQMGQAPQYPSQAQQVRPNGQEWNPAGQSQPRRGVWARFFLLGLQNTGAKVARVCYYLALVGALWWIRGTVIAMLDPVWHRSFRPLVIFVSAAMTTLIGLVPAIVPHFVATRLDRRPRQAAAPAPQVAPGWQQTNGQSQWAPPNAQQARPASQQPWPPGSNGQPPVRPNR